MLHAHILGRRIKPAIAAPVALLTQVAPFSPARYLRTRRAHAGLSVHQVAKRLSPKHAGFDAACDLIRMLETDGVTARETETLLALRNVYPFDITVYRQLAMDPPEQHPAICQDCGCSQWDPCRAPYQDYCAWHTPTSCSACAPDASS